MVGAAVFWIAYDNGGYGLESRGTVAIAVWWAVVVAIVFGLLQREPVSRASIAIGGLLAALALWTLASLLWSPSAEKTFDEFNRATLYLGVFVLVTLASSRRTVGRLVDGLTIAIPAVAVVALASRLFPGVFPEGDVPTFLPSAVTRLSYPLGYWNGLAIFVALGVPLLLRAAVVARSPAVQGLALVPLPVIAAVVYLASSRGGAVTAFAGSAAFLALTEYRWRAAIALLLSLLGSAVVLGILLDREELVDGPLGTELVERQGRSAALAIALTCVVSGALYGVGSRLLSGRIPQPRPAVGWAAVLAVVLFGAAGVAAADPVERYRVFKLAPGEGAPIERGDFVRQHLLSGSGSGRWQFWTAALDQWEQAPVLGQGAGTYESWWAEHRTISHFVRDAHSLYLETLGELGIVGFALVLALVLVGVAVGARRARAVSDDRRVTVAALTGVFVAFAAAAGFDWVWELSVVGVVAFVAVALLCGAGTALPAPLSAVNVPRQPFRARYTFGLGAVVLLAAWCLVLAQAIPLLAQGEVNDSEAALARGDLDAAFTSARAARDIQPWAATPYLQLALVSEEARLLPQAREWIGEAIERDDRNWRLWLVSARLETKLSRVAAAERSLRRAVSLNPRSPLFTGFFEDDADE